MEGLGKAICITPATKPDAQTDIQSYYGQLAIMKCTDAVQIGICVAKNREYIVDELEQHVETSAFRKGDFVTTVTPSIVMEGKERPDIDRAIAIRVNQGEGVFF